MPNTPLTWRPGAVATPIGWAHEVTGEHLVSRRGLDADDGTDVYAPNSPAWMKAYQEGRDPDEPGDDSSGTIIDSP